MKRNYFNFTGLAMILFLSARLSLLQTEVPASSATAPETGKPSQSLAAIIESYIQSFPSHEEFSGVILVADKDKILFHKGYGQASREFDIANGTETRFQIGSITKAFTAMIALKLSEQGIVDLDKRIADYLPYYPKESGAAITIRQLLGNTSGIAHHYQIVPDYFRADDHFFHTPKELLRLFWNAPLKHAPGQEFTYSSPGYYIVGSILQQASKKSYNELLQEIVCKPLGMKNTLVENNRTTDRNLATGYIRGINGLVKAYVEDKSTALAAGDLISTAHDLFLWQRTVHPQADGILSAESKKTMFQPVLPESPLTMAGPHFTIPYENGNKTLAISLLTGSSSGYASCISRQTGLDRCVIVLSNINGDDVARIADDIGDIILRRVYGMAVGEEAPLTRIPPQAARLSDLDASKILGFYRSPDGNYCGVIRQGQKLYCLDFNKKSGMQFALQMVPLTPESFYLGHNPSFRCDISYDENGEVQGLAALRKGRTFAKASRFRAEGIDVSEFAGHYASLELQRTFHFFISGSGLAAINFLGENEMKLTPLEKDLFGFDLGFIRFSRDLDGSIDGFSLFSKDCDAYFGSGFIRISEQ